MEQNLELLQFLLDAVLKKLEEETNLNETNTNVLILFDKLAEIINQPIIEQNNKQNEKKFKLLKSRTLYKNFYLAVRSKNIVQLSNLYLNSLLKYAGYNTLEDLYLTINSDENSTLFIEEITHFQGYTFETVGVLNRFSIIFDPEPESVNVNVNLQSLRHTYKGTAVRRGQSILIDIEMDTNEKKIQSRVVMFVGGKSLAQTEILLGIYIQTDSKGNPYAAKTVFVKTKDLEEPKYISNVSPDYLKVPAEIRNYLHQQKNNEIAVTESENFKLSDLAIYKNKSLQIMPYVGYYELFFHEEKDKVSKVFIQILPEGQVFYKGSQNQYTGLAELKAGNLYLKLANLTGDKEAMIILFVGSAETKDGIVFQGVYSSVSSNFMPWAGRLVAIFRPNIAMTEILIDDQNKFEAKKIKKEEDQSLEHIFNYLANSSENEVFLVPVRKFNLEELSKK